MAAMLRSQPLIAVRDVEASSRFYQRLLGCQNGHGGPEYERLTFDGELVLQLHEADTADNHGTIGDPALPYGNGVLLWFAIEAFEEAVARARDLGAEIVHEPHVNPNARQRECWLRDPDRYTVVLASPPSDVEGRATMYDPERGYPAVIPCVLYADPAAAVHWLGEVLGLREALRVSMPEGGVGHAELVLGDHVVMIGVAGGERFGEVSSITLVFVDDVDATCERALAAGGTVVGEPLDQPWGLRQALIADPEGQRWEITQYVRDVGPETWGAEILDAMPGHDTK